MKKLKVALVYDRVNKWGGAERVLLALHKIFPDAPLYTSVYKKNNAPWADVFNVKTSFLQHIPFLSSHHELVPFLMPLAFESFSFDEYDLVISVTSEAAKGIVTKGKTRHICYCLTPTRYLWSGYDEYFKNAFLRFVSYPVVLFLRQWDKLAAQRPDVIISISREVSNRVKKYYGRTSPVVYPPSLLESGTTSKNKDGKYFLIVSRLVPYKRIDIAIKACNELQLPLKIIGVGSDYEKLKGLAGPSIEFLGSLTDKEVVSYYKNCKAFIFAGNEDFGISVIEAQASGKPVIAYKAGGVLETVVHNKTGIFFTPQTKEALKSILLTFDVKKFKESDCRAQAEKFSFKNFQKNFLKEVNKYC